MTTIQAGKWLWVFDNINFQQRVRHEHQGNQTIRNNINIDIQCSDRHSSMMSPTSRLAVCIRYLPDWEFDWTDKKLQRIRESLNITDFLPTEQDFEELKKKSSELYCWFLGTGVQKSAAITWVYL